MELKENIKSKVDKLDPYDLRLLEILIDSLSGKRKISRRKIADSKPFFLEVINLIGPSGLSTNDINVGREERI